MPRIFSRNLLFQPLPSLKYCDNHLLCAGDDVAGGHAPLIFIYLFIFGVRRVKGFEQHKRLTSLMYGVEIMKRLFSFNLFFSCALPENKGKKRRRWQQF